MLAGFAPRKIDELLRNPGSSLADILSDEEAISEFRSANAKLVARLLEVDGMDFIVRLITNRDLDDSLTPLQKQHLPFIASELVACEVDSMLDAFTRIIPGTRTPLDRMFDALVDGHETNPTVLGYIIRVLLVLINRRVSVVDKYIAEHHQVIMDALVDLMFDKSVADLLFRLCLDEDVRSFRLDFNKLLSSLNSSNCDNIFWLIDSVFGKPLLGNNERVTNAFTMIRSDLIDKEGLGKLVDLALAIESGPVATTAMNIVSVLLQYSFSRAGSAQSSPFSELSTPLDNTGWETFNTLPSSSNVPIAVSHVIDEDSCVFDDEDDVTTGSPPPLNAADTQTDPKPLRFPLTPFTEFGAVLIAPFVSRLSGEEGSAVFSQVMAARNLMQTHAFVRLISYLVKYNQQISGRLEGTFVGSVVSTVLFRYPSSSAIHNACRDCVINDSLSVDEVSIIASAFIPPAVAYLAATSVSSGGCFGHVCRILYHITKQFGDKTVLAQYPASCDKIAWAAKRWVEIDTRLADRDQQPSRVPSPQGVMPIIDLDPGSLDQFVPVFTIDSPTTDSLSPQVRFEPGSSLTELSSSTDSWGNVGIVDEPDSARSDI